LRTQEKRLDLPSASLIATQLWEITHDTRNALAAIRATAQLGTFLAKEHPNYSELFQEIMHNVDRANQELQKLVEIRNKLMETHGLDQN